MGNSSSENHIFSNKPRQREFFVLVFFDVYYISITLSAFSVKVPVGAAIVSIIACLLSWILYAGQYFSYDYRATLHIIFILVAQCTYAFFSDAIEAHAIPFIAISILICFFGNPKKLMFPAIAFIVMMVEVFFINGDGLNTPHEVYSFLSISFNVALSLGVLAFGVHLITESQKSNESLIDDLQDAETSRDDFLANVSHEIRTPINTIAGMSDMVLEEENLSPIVKEDIQSIQIASRNLLSVVTDVLDYSELQAGKVILYEQSYSTSRLIDEVLLMSNAWAADKHLELIVNCNPNLPMHLVGDENKIKRVFLNIINNAIKFTNEGCIVLDVDCRKESYGVNLIVSVTDTGIGMSPESIEQIYSNFAQVDAKRNRLEGGMGLGLAITQFLVSQMGGTLSVKSSLGYGSSFKFVIPQKIDGVETIVKLKNPEKINALLYVNLEQFRLVATRDAYLGNLKTLVKELGINAHFCRNIKEFKRRCDNNEYTHAFISPYEYVHDKEFFNELSKKIIVVTTYDEYTEDLIESDDIVRIIKPFYIAPVVDVFNMQEKVIYHSLTKKQQQYKAPDVKVLLVDDNIMNLKVAISYLKKYDIQYDTATSGLEAIEKIDAKDFDFVFMDHMMPEMDGVETVEHIRNKHGSYFKDVPIIALTANDVPGAREMFLTHGFNAFISKPIDAISFAKILDEFVPLGKRIAMTAKAENEAHNVSQDLEQSSVNKNMRASAMILNQESKTDNSVLSIANINTDMGLKYCGSMEDYIDVLELNIQEEDKTIGLITKTYEQEDWKNYGVYVHGLKSSMKMIGAMDVSELAKTLEFAAKNDQIDTIKQNNDSLIENYKDQVESIKTGLGAYLGKSYDDESKDAPILVNDLEAEEIDKLLSRFEVAVYTFDPKVMLSVLDETSEKTFAGKPTKEAFKEVYKKIAMSDFMSAFDKLSEIVKG